VTQVSDVAHGPLVENPHLIDTTSGICSGTVSEVTSLMAVSSLISNKDRGLIEHLLEPAMYLCKDFYAIWNPIKV
jgi:hypothetical protein